MNKTKGFIILKLTKVIDFLNKHANDDDPVEFYKTKIKNQRFKTNGKKLKRWGVK